MCIGSTARQVGIPAAPQVDENAGIQMALLAQRQKQAAAQGRRSTMLSGLQAENAQPSTPKTYLGQ